MATQHPIKANPDIVGLASRVARLGTWTLDLTDDRVLWSPELEDVFGLERGTFGGTQAAFHALVEPADLPRLNAAIAESIRSGTEYCVIFRYRHKGGEWRWMEGRGLPTYDTDGKPLRLDGVGIDVTERTQAENTRFRLAAIVESSDDAIISKTLDGIVTSWNASAVRLFGYTAEEMIGTSITRLIPRDLLPEETEIIAKLRRGERIEHYETRRLTKDGTFVDVSLTVSPVLDVTGSIVGASKIARNITAWRLAMAERDHLLESERTARNEAERLGLLKDEFLATLSHELRTPLTAILGWCNVLRRRRNLTESDLKDAVETIHRNAKAQTQIIEDLLDMSRIVSGKIRLETDDVDLGDLVQVAVDGIRPSASAKRITVRMLRDPNAGYVSGDTSRLQQVFWNLLTNAVKFTPAEGLIRVTVQRVNQHVEVLVEDSGIGIKPDFLPFVFERFRQADGSTTRQHGGLGLGLSIVRNLVELHGGAVSVDSAGPGLGSSFVVRLPLSVTSSQALRQESLRDVSGTPDPLTALDGALILVVDDEPDGRTLLARLLEETGAQVLTAHSAAQALQILSLQPVSVLISDIGMPGLDGYEFIRRVRALEHATNRNVPAIALTAYARTEDRDRSLAAGFQQHISKPYSIPELAAVTARLWRNLPAAPAV